MRLKLDTETRSHAKLKVVGPKRYALDPTTQIFAAAWQVDDGPISKWCGVEGLGHLGNAPLGLLIHLMRHADKIVIQNAQFDLAVLSAKFFLSPDLYKRVECTQARAQRLSLPGGIDAIGEALGVGGKHPFAKEVKAAFSPDAKGRWRESEDLIRKVMVYVEGDVKVMSDVDRRLPELPPAERRIWERTWRKNERGLPLDLELVEAIAAQKERIDDEYGKELADLTRMDDGKSLVTKVTQTQRLKKLFVEAGVQDPLEPGQPLTSLDKEHVEALLERDDLTNSVRAALLILQEAGGAAPRKAATILERHVNGFLLDTTRYHGARSGRGTSEGVNMFNIARPSGKTDIPATIKRLLAGGNASNLELTDALRGVVKYDAIIDADFSNIELRIVRWLSGDAEFFDSLRADAAAGREPDPYMPTARKMFRLPPDATKKTHKKERQDTKPVVLGGNYELGHKTFYEQNRKLVDGLTLEQSMLWINAYRRDNPKLVKLWKDYKEAGLMAVRTPGAPISVGPVTWLFQEGRIDLILPSGRVIPHYDARITSEGDLVYWRAKKGAMRMAKAYGGAWTEIICQSIARDILTHAEEAIEDELPHVDLRLDIYDSIVGLCPADRAEGAKNAMLEIMRRPVKWAPELLLDAEGSVTDRMEK